MTAAVQGIAAAISHCLDQEEEMQELFLGSTMVPPLPQPAVDILAEAALAHPVDTGRIEIERADSDGLREALMSA
ncbi:hypothetical protein ABPG75_002468 [Micractinium tetrahymenae]